MLKLGSHISFKSPDYLVGAAKESMKNGANAMMIYLGPPQSTLRVSMEKYKLDEYKEKYMEHIPLDSIVVHAPYIVNPANPEKWEFARDFLTQEIERMNYIGIKNMVLHPGAHVKHGWEKARDTLVNTLKEVIANTEDVVICLETMSGKGTEIGITFEQLREIYELVGSERIAVCLDTCHIWDGGYDVNDYDQLMKDLRTTKVLELIKVVHINDSKNDLGAHKDRHENLGKGQIKVESLIKLINTPEFKDIVQVLETPNKGDINPYKDELKLLRGEK